VPAPGAPAQVPAPQAPAPKTAAIELLRIDAIREQDQEPSLRTYVRVPVALPFFLTCPLDLEDSGAAVGYGPSPKGRERRRTSWGAVRRPTVAPQDRQRSA
jgi:hypothetical protein